MFLFQVGAVQTYSCRLMFLAKSVLESIRVFNLKPMLLANMHVPLVTQYVLWFLVYITYNKMLNASVSHVLE